MPIPSNTPIVANTGQIIDGVIQGADIGNTQITVAKMVPGNNGEVMTTVAGSVAWAAPSSIPAGSVFPYAGTSAPSGYLFADGSTVSQTTYATLFAVIAHTYGADPGGGNFILPDLRGRVAVGKNAGTFNTLGGTGGEETHVLTVPEIPAHHHGLTGAGGSGGSHVNQTSTATVTTDQTQDTGGGGAHNNLQPYITLNYVIKT